MSEPAPVLDREAIEEAFRRLEQLAKRGVVADIYVFGGAAMTLAYDSRRATRDVDALFKPHGIVLEEPQAVGAELGLPKWWLMVTTARVGLPALTHMWQIDGSHFGSLPDINARGAQVTPEQVEERRRTRAAPPTSPRSSTPPARPAVRRAACSATATSSPTPATAWKMTEGSPVRRRRP